MPPAWPNPWRITSAQSEQLATRIWIRTGGTAEHPVAAGMLLQSLPASGETHANEFEHLSTLTATIKEEELFNLEAEEILHRLYHEEEVLLFEPQTIRFRCTCSGSAVKTPCCNWGNKKSKSCSMNRARLICTATTAVLTTCLMP